MHACGLLISTSAEFHFDSVWGRCETSKILLSFEPPPLNFALPPNHEPPPPNHPILHHSSFSASTHTHLSHSHTHLGDNFRVLSSLLSKSKRPSRNRSNRRNRKKVPFLLSSLGPLIATTPRNKTHYPAISPPPPLIPPPKPPNQHKWPPSSHPRSLR